MDVTPEDLARAILDQFWLAQVERIARRALARAPEWRDPLQMYPPRAEDYALAAEALRRLTRSTPTDAVADAAKTSRVITRVKVAPR